MSEVGWFYLWFEQFTSYITSCLIKVGGKPVVMMVSHVYHFGETHDNGYGAVKTKNMIRANQDSNQRHRFLLCMPFRGSCGKHYAQGIRDNMPVCGSCGKHLVQGTL